MTRRRYKWTVGSSAGYIHNTGGYTRDLQHAKLFQRKDNAILVADCLSLVTLSTHLSVMVQVDWLGRRSLVSKGAL